MLVIVPTVVPTTTTLTPGKVEPSRASVTVPVTVVWATAYPNDNRRAHATKSGLRLKILLIAFDLSYKVIYLSYVLKHYVLHNATKICDNKISAKYFLIIFK
jgi:hypothetical protein